jgi:hypothetical protein
MVVVMRALPGKDYKRKSLSKKGIFCSAAKLLTKILKD